MHYSLRDLDHIKSIVEQDITAMEAEKIVGGSGCAADDLYCQMNQPPKKDEPLPPCKYSPITSLLDKADLQLQISVKLKDELILPLSKNNQLLNSTSTL